MNLIESTSSVIQAGDHYGRYTVLGIFKASNGYQKYAHVACSCGSAPRMIQIGPLRNGTSQSCGCLHKEAVTKHGQWGKPLFSIWRAMIRRCTNPKDRRFDRYGGRGITVCDRWMSAANFIADMSPTYSQGLTLDRINNDGPYSPENCRWVSRSLQNRNYSRNLLIAFRGEVKCLKDWAKALNINYGTLWDRIKVQKLSPEDAFSKG